MMRLRFSLYCHNGEGFGHIVRTLHIARALRAHDPSAEILVVTGCHALDRVDWPDGVDRCALPPLDLDETYGLSDSAPKMAKRARLIGEAIDAFRPDLLLADTLPFGMRGELHDVVTRREPSFMKVLGMPYPFVKPDRASYPRRPSGAHLYDGLIAYTDPGTNPILNTVPHTERRKPAYMGYVADRAVSEPEGGERASPVPRVVVLNGGGSRLTILPFLDEVLLPLGAEGRITVRVLAGILSRGEMAALYGGRQGVEVIPQMSAAEAVQGADLVFSRCGYNTALAVLQQRAPVVFAPERKMDEQVQRATAFSRLDRVWMIEESPQALARVLPEALASGRADRALRLPLDGAANSASWLHSAAGNWVCGRAS